MGWNSRPSDLLPEFEVAAAERLDCLLTRPSQAVAAQSAKATRSGSLGSIATVGLRLEAVKPGRVVVSVLFMGGCVW